MTISRKWLILFALWFLALNLHLLRNVSILYYAAVAMLTLAVVMIGGYRFSISRALTSYLIFLASFCYITFISFLYFAQVEYYSDPASIANAISRLLFVMPLTLVVAGKRWSVDDVNCIIKLFAAFTAIGALTIPLQFAIGPISWFVEPSSRAGFSRFGSLFGNLTSIGIVGGLGIIATIYSTYTNRIKLLLLSCIVVGLLLSLQKAAVANFMLAALLLLYFYPANTRLKVRYIQGVLFAMLVLVLALWLVLGDVATATLENFRITSSESGGDDYSVSESIAQRLFELPKMSIEFYGWPKILWGVGLAGSAGVAGYEDMPMSHNFFVDLTLMGGIVIPLIFIAMTYKIFVQLQHHAMQLHDSKIQHRQLAWTMSIYVLINLPFASGVLFQPNIGAMYWWLAGLVLSGYFFSDNMNIVAVDARKHV